MLKQVQHDGGGYMTGFGNHFATEAVAGALPRGRNSPQRPAFGLYTEQLSGTEGKVKYFEGTPIPTSVAIVGLLALAAWQGSIGAGLWGGAWRIGPWLLHPLVLVYAVSGSLMISKTLRIPKL